MARAIRIKYSMEEKAIELLAGEVDFIGVQDRNFFESFSYTPYNEEEFFGFFKKIIKGRISLYRYKDRLFVKKGGDPLREVTKKQKRVEATLIANDYSGLGVLRTLMTDCNAVNEQFLLDNYVDEDGIKKIVNTYNSCFPEGTTEIPDIKVPSHADLGIQATLNEANLSFSKTILSGAHFGWSASIGGGAWLSLFTPAMGDNLRFVVEPSFGQYNAYSYYTDYLGTNDVFIRYSFVRMPVMMRYFYKNMFVDLGVSNMIVIRNHNTWRQETSSDNFIVTAEGPAYKINTGVVGPVGGVGVKTRIAGIPVLTSLRASGIFRLLNGATYQQPAVRWLDFNVALQLTRH